MIYKWVDRFLNLAEYISTWSKDPSTKVGAVITSGKNKIISHGYNGFPPGVRDTEERLNNRELKYPLTVHAEKNAIAFADKSLHDATMYVTRIPCTPCAAYIIANEVGSIVCPLPEKDEFMDRWIKDAMLSAEIFRESGTLFYCYDKKNDNLVEGYNVIRKLYNELVQTSSS